MSQIYIPADPFNLLYAEKEVLLGHNRYGTLTIRPLFKPAGSNSAWSLKVRSEFYYNSNAPNLENMSDK